MTDDHYIEDLYESLARRIGNARRQEGLAVYEIGECLCQVKSQLPGRFLAFLKDARVNLAARVAQMHMRVARAEDGRQLARFGLVKANALLKLSPEDRRQLMEEHNLMVVSVSKLRGMIAELTGQVIVSRKRVSEPNQLCAAFEEGRAQGYDAGFSEGFNAGEQAGNRKGKVEGFNEGHQAGFRSGQLSAWFDSDTRWAAGIPLLGAIADAVSAHWTEFRRIGTLASLFALGGAAYLGVLYGFGFRLRDVKR